jgi:hypothetical protein
VWRSVNCVGPRRTRAESAQSDRSLKNRRIPWQDRADDARGACRIDIGGWLGENGDGFRETPGHATMTLRNALKTLLVLSLALPLVAGVLMWVGGLLRAMGDAAGATAIGYVGTACQVVWLVCLVGLLVTLAMTVLAEGPTDGTPPAEGDRE